MWPRVIRSWRAYSSAQAESGPLGEVEGGMAKPHGLTQNAGPVGAAMTLGIMAAALDETKKNIPKIRIDQDDHFLRDHSRHIFFF